MKFKRVGKIISINEIEFNKDVIISGTYGKGWFLRAKGHFENREGMICFIDKNGCLSEYKGGKIDLSILEEV